MKIIFCVVLLSGKMLIIIRGEIGNAVTKWGKLKSSNNSYSFPFNISYRKICKYTLDVKVLL